MKSYGYKNICEVDIFDYLNLNENPMYLKIDEKDKNAFYGVSLVDSPRKGYIKVISIYQILIELRKHSFVFEKNTNKILKYIQGQLYP